MKVRSKGYLKPAQLAGALHRIKELDKELPAVFEKITFIGETSYKDEFPKLPVIAGPFLENVSVKANLPPAKDLGELLMTVHQTFLRAGMTGVKFGVEVSFEMDEAKGGAEAVGIVKLENTGEAFLFTFRVKSRDISKVPGMRRALYEGLIKELQLPVQIQTMQNGFQLVGNDGRVMESTGRDQYGSPSDLKCEFPLVDLGLLVKKLGFVLESLKTGKFVHRYWSMLGRTIDKEQDYWRVLSDFSNLGIPATSADMRLVVEGPNYEAFQEISKLCVQGQSVSFLAVAMEFPLRKRAGAPVHVVMEPQGHYLMIHMPSPYRLAKLESELGLKMVEVGEGESL